ncbi:MAG: hypothetical protein JWO78_274 [Micavibrio sp.]|nr:hypothetical protein [Micavibrio sp.]
MAFKSLFCKIASGGFAAVTASAAFAALPALPLAEDVLAAEGLSKPAARAMVERLAGTNSVRVLDVRNLFKLRHDLFKRGMEASGNNNKALAKTYQGMALELSKGNNPDNGEFIFDRNARAYHSGTLSFPSVLTEDEYQTTGASCYVKIQEDGDIRNLLKRTAGIPEGSVEKLLITPREISLIALLHELRHCSPDNVFPNKEIDADLHALQEAGLFRADYPFLAERWAYFRVLNPEFGVHLTALSIDANNRNERELTFNELIVALGKTLSLRAAKIDSLDLHQISRKPGFLIDAVIYRAILDDQKLDIHPLAARLMQLHLHAAETIAPKQFAATFALVKEKPAKAAGPLPR